jgi:AcrR family transcriptional regulator
MKSWTIDNPKAPMMKRKRAAIIAAALQEFLDNGYSQTSMDRISSAAGVSVKTVYRHFDNKDDLFSTVMKAACSPNGLEELNVTVEGQNLQQEKEWFSKPPHVALVMAGVEYLSHALSRAQLALYRVVTQDAHRFPEIGRRYRIEVIQNQKDIFDRYLDRWIAVEGWNVRNSQHAASTFIALLRSDLFDDVLHGLREVDSSEINVQAGSAAEIMLILLKSGRL